MSTRTLVIGKETHCAEGIADKVRSDIAFLQDKLQHAKAQEGINNDVITTYQGMLTSRQNVLRWLEQDQTQSLSA